MVAAIIIPIFFFIILLLGIMEGFGVFENKTANKAIAEKRKCCINCSHYKFYNSLDGESRYECKRGIGNNNILGICDDFKYDSSRYDYQQKRKTYRKSTEYKTKRKGVLQMKRMFFKFIVWSIFVASTVIAVCELLGVSHILGGIDNGWLWAYIIGSGLIEVIGFIFILTIKDGKMNTTDMIEKTFKNTKGGLWLSIINTVILALVLIFGGIEKAQQFKKMKKKNNKEQDND